MTTRFLSRLVVVCGALFVLAGCGGGGGGGGGSSSTSSGPTASVSATPGGVVTPGTQTVTSGATVTYTITPDADYSISTSSPPSGCGGTYNPATPNTYTTGKITGSCTVSVAFTVNTTGTVPLAPTVTGFGVKQVTLRWPSVSGATSYKVLETLASSTTPTQAVSNCTTTSGTVSCTVPISVTMNGGYQIQACNNATGCSPFNSLSTINGIIGAIGYAKSNTTPIALANLGSSIAVSRDGNTVVVGASGDGGDGVSTRGPGAVYVFARNSVGTWSFQAKLLSNLTTSVQFGYSVTLSDNGNVLAAGAPGAFTVYIFTRSNTTWGSPVTVTSPDPGNIISNPNGFGYAVSLSGDGSLLAVGAPGTTVNGATAAGAMHLFTHGTSWTYQKTVTEPAPSGTNTTNAGDRFGSAVALSDDASALAAGAPFEDSSSTNINSTPDELATDSGAVFVFLNNGGAWTQGNYVKAFNTGAGDNFGSAVALSANGLIMAVGAPYEDGSATTVCSNLPNCTSDNNATDAGAAYIFYSPGLAGGYYPWVYVKPTNNSAGDWFGTSLALTSDGNTLVVGANKEASNATGINGVENNTSDMSAGAAYIFSDHNAITNNWSQTVYVKATNTNQSQFFGQRVAVSGDASTLAVAAPAEASNATGLCAWADSTCQAAQMDTSTGGAGAAYLY